MKKLNLISLSRNEMRNVSGGKSLSDEVGSPCDSCTQLCHQDSNGNYGYGMCSSSTGGSSCHNYCCAKGQPTYWC